MTLSVKSCRCEKRETAVSVWCSVVSDVKSFCFVVFIVLVYSWLTMTNNSLIITFAWLKIRSISYLSMHTCYTGLFFISLFNQFNLWWFNLFQKQISSSSSQSQQYSYSQVTFIYTALTIQIHIYINLDKAEVKWHVKIHKNDIMQFLSLSLQWRKEIKQQNETK